MSPASASATPSDAKLGSGATAIVFDEPAVASVDVRGGGPGTRETALLDPAQTVEGIDAIVLSGGSAFGLDAASGVQAYLREQGRGFAGARGARADRAGRDPVRPACRAATRTGAAIRPIASSATRRRKSAGADFALGSAGAGLGATTVNLKGGIGSASARTRERAHASARIAAANAAGSVTIGDSAAFLGGAVRAGQANSAGAAGRHRFPPMP